MHVPWYVNWDDDYLSVVYLKDSNHSRFIGTFTFLLEDMYLISSLDILKD